MQNAVRPPDRRAKAIGLVVWLAAFAFAWFLGPPLDQTVLFKDLTGTLEKPGEELPLDGELASVLRVSIAGQDLGFQPDDLLVLRMRNCTELNVLSGDLLPEGPEARPRRRAITLTTSDHGKACDAQLRVESVGTPRPPVAYSLSGTHPLRLELPLDRVTTVLKRFPVDSVRISGVKREGGDIGPPLSSSIDRLFVAASGLRLSLEIPAEDTTKGQLMGARATLATSWATIPSAIEISGEGYLWLWVLAKVMLLVTAVGAIKTAFGC